MYSQIRSGSNVHLGDSLLPPDKSSTVYEFPGKVSLMALMSCPPTSDFEPVRDLYHQVRKLVEFTLHWTCCLMYNRYLISACTFNQPILSHRE